MRPLPAVRARHEQGLEAAVPLDGRGSDLDKSVMQTGSHAGQKCDLLERLVVGAAAKKSAYQVPMAPNGRSRPPVDDEIMANTDT